MVPSLLARLLSIEYIDVAEQCLQALEKISRSEHLHCLLEGAAMAALSYIYFFPKSTQRVAVSIVTNVCKKIPLDCSGIVMDVVPTLCNLLQYEDQKLVDIAAASLISITKCFSNSSELLDELCKHGVVDQSVQLITLDGRRMLSRTTYDNLIWILDTLAAVSLVSVRTLFELKISSTLKDILVTSDCSHHEVYRVLRLLNQLVPPAARDDQDIQLILGKEKILVDQPKYLHQFAMDILPVLTQVMSNSGASFDVCYGCISNANSIVYFCTPDMLLDLFKNTNISSFLASLLAQKNNHVLFLTLKTVELLMQKLPHVLSSSFSKEGVNHAINALVPEDHPLPVTQQSCDIQGANKERVARYASKCLCYAFGFCQSSDKKACRLGKDAVPTLAACIRATYFTESTNSMMGLTESLQQLKTYCAVLNDRIDRYMINCRYPQGEEYLAYILSEIMKELNGKEALSTFEFVESGIVRTLAHYLSSGKYLNRSSSDQSSSDHFLLMLKRSQIFTNMSLSESAQSLEDMPLTLLVKKLQNALSSFDNFPVILSHVSKLKAIQADVPIRCSTVLPCLKVRFVREEGESSLCEFDDVLIIELSSPFSAIEEVLWPKVAAKKIKRRGLSKAVNKFLSKLKGSSHQEQPPLTYLDAHTNPGKLMTGTTSDLSSTGDCVENRITSASQSNQDSQKKLIFCLNGEQIDQSITLYQAILQHRINAEPGFIVGPAFWKAEYKMTYRRAKGLMQIDSEVSYVNSQSYLSLIKFPFSWKKLPFFSSLLLAELPCKLEKSNPSYDILFILKVLEGLNRFSFQLLSYERSNAFAEGRIDSLDNLKVMISSVPKTEFISSKMTEKLEQQMRDPLALSTGCMPSWCTYLMDACPFLFSFDARRKYFYLTTIGSIRIQQNQVQDSDSDNTDLTTGTYPRIKFRVSRRNIRKSAAEVMASSSRRKGLLEVEYYEEVGTGLGPTIEFYTLVSHELQKTGLGMWRGDQKSLTAQLNSGTGKIVAGLGLIAPFGLFPRPWAAISFSDGIQFSEVIKSFVLLGQLVARAIKDGRILDLPFARAFYKVILEKELDIYDIQSFDPELGRTLVEFQALANRKSFVESHSGKHSRNTIDLSFRSTRIEDLCLDFTLPGYSDYVLGCGSNLIMVTKKVNINNLEEYVSLVVDATVGSGICRQLEAFKTGFNEVFPLKALQVFTEDELECLLCGEQDSWTMSELRNHIKFDHGYTASSPPVINLLEIIQEFGFDQRRAFLQFVTGSPRLPPGGLASLDPNLTIVCKHCSNGADMELPSVMTCANYLKLPPYSSKERMKQKLLYAITEGQGSFHLS